MKYSAGIVLWRTAATGGAAIGGAATSDQVEILLVHPGGPFWANKDEHAWSIPKGEYDPAEQDPLTVARREFTEELGHPAPEGEGTDLGELPTSGKRIRVWLYAGDLDPTTITSNMFEMQWPPRSGRMASFPEVDRADWFTLDAARTKLHKGQVPLIDRVEQQMGSRG